MKKVIKGNFIKLSEKYKYFKKRKNKKEESKSKTIKKSFKKYSKKELNDFAI